ncbi:MAG: 6-carboxytetrahydropterin synthase QueD [Janthinobacterium lividum]
MEITRRIEFDAGHRIPDHRSQCRNMHGHRYALEITLAGELVAEAGAPDRGMVMDFAAVKELAIEHVAALWDHAFLVYDGDSAVRAFLETLPDHKTVVIDRIPTVENLAMIAFEILQPVYAAQYRNQIVLSRLRLYETPNCWAEVSA